MQTEPRVGSDVPIGELVSQLSAQTSRLVRDEMRLAQKEFANSAKHAGMGAGFLSAAGLAAVFGVAAVVTAAVAALALVLPVWAAALIVAVILFAIAGIAALTSRKQLTQASPTPEMTVASVKQDLDEVKGVRHDR
ncbi:integral membrane protein [Mycolicibacterium mageritense DSM 44476 = CIP 104973]|uniref:Membrane protein n=1 Tax=Mycolicibacterium mageritense TaxID=53462 RepID=A0AAI8TSL4_MYCME|nr:phage holin family protein [Mycolicibacterium mageritense]MBN3459406.1 phage holin family protein [Mycobacterium sp. DSM 3803]OKH70069.1 membrane protein [Mycobacterium sp. SWH-M3]MCC9179640.1 phage holin family protein [Mycolicibacterium mageritense]TXI65900.1 MAG: phage holin family protein [Mycolicibacterium mageritense]CDO21736.1 integral membrane protein [Mycolicibacterium mageritense DSM 44476 = CIP 104973]